MRAALLVLATVDLFISAGQRETDEFQRRGLLVNETRRVFACNVLVAVSPTDSRADLSRATALLEPAVTKIAIGNPKAVPVGQYTEESLRSLGVWDRVRGKLVLAENVRQVLEYVSRAEVDSRARRARRSSAGSASGFPSIAM